MSKKEKKLVYKIDQVSGNLLCKGKPIEPITDPLEHIERILDPIKEQIEKSYKSIDVKSLMLEPLSQMDDYIKALDAVSPAKLAKERLENAASSILRQYDTNALFKSASEYLDTMNQYITSQKEMMAIAEEAQRQLMGFGEYAKAFALSNSIIIPQKEIILTDEGFTLDQRLIALDLTARKFQAYIDEEINDEDVKELAIARVSNIQMISYASNEAIMANQYLVRAKTFFKHLAESGANSIKEDEEGFYYDLLLEAHVRHINAHIALKEPIEKYRKVRYIKETVQTFVSATDS